MNYSALEKCPLFNGVPANELREDLEKTLFHIKHYDKGEIIFRLMEPATRIGIILEGSVEIQKYLPNGKQVNLSVAGQGKMIGAAAVFSKIMKYPCNIVALESVDMMIFQKKDILGLMQKDVRIIENFTTEIASAAYMMQLRLELFSYSGIAQKAAFWLLMHAKQGEKKSVTIPSVFKWAMLMNVSRSSLHRELKHLEEQSVISYTPPVIEILDPNGLKKILNI